MKEFKNCYIISLQEILASETELRAILEQSFHLLYFTKWDGSESYPSHVFERNSMELVDFHKESQKFLVKISLVGQTNFLERFSITYSTLLRDHGPFADLAFETFCKESLRDRLSMQVETNALLRELKTVENKLPEYNIRLFPSTINILDMLNLDPLDI